MKMTLQIGDTAVPRDAGVSGSRSGAGLGWKSRAIAGGCALSALFLLAGSGSGWADEEAVPRAVESLNFTGLAELRVLQVDLPLGQGTATGKLGLAGGRVTAPLGDRFGIRLALGGGMLTSSGASLQPGSRSLVNAGGDIFIRDPDRGYVQLGYRWNGDWRVDRTDTQIADSEGSLHQLLYSLGFFKGDFDFELGVGYERFAPELTVTTVSTGAREEFSFSRNGFRLLGGSTWYAADSLALGFGVEWGRKEIPGFDNGVSSSPALHEDEFQARFGADWQPPVASLRAGTTVGLSVGLGYYTAGFREVTVGAGPTTTVEIIREFAYDVRLGVTVYFPGAHSLKERARSYQ